MEGEQPMIRLVQILAIAAGIIMAVLLSGHPVELERNKTIFAMVVLLLCMIGDGTTEGWIIRHPDIEDTQYHLFRAIAMYPIEGFVWIYGFDSWWPDRILVAMGSFITWKAAYRLSLKGRSKT